MSPTDQRSLGTDATCTLLENPRRRTLVSVLLETEAATVDELAREIAARERGGALDPDDELRQRVHVSLVHNHVPRLADHDVVVYDRESGTVEPTELLAELEGFVAGRPEPADSGVALQFSQS